MTHPIVHIEIPAKDPVAASTFYASAFGWATQAIPEFNYVTFTAQPGPGGGFNPLSDDIKIGDVLVYINTDDIEASLSTIEALGGKRLYPKTEIPGVGWFAYFADPDGNRVALFTPLPGTG